VTLMRPVSRRHGRIRLLTAVILVTSVSATVLAGPALSSPSRPAATPPKTVSATQLASSDSPPFARRGKVVNQSHLFPVRVFVSARNGFAMADVNGAQYPATTVDGGKTWKIAGPHFHKNALDAPDAVTQVGAVRPSTYFAYAGPDGGQPVIVSTDRGKHWWRAYMPGVPLAVTSSHIVNVHGALVALVEAGPGKLWAYVSTDGGHHWHYSKKFI
jgi:hypothetical protein